MERESMKHFILVHGACHGAWCWYKVATSLRESGYRVTVPDLGASGVNEKRLDELHRCIDYSQPLLEIMASLPPQEKVILVGHSFGGFIISLAMEMFPAKISAAVFVTAFMPKLASPPLHILDKFFAPILEELLFDGGILLQGPPGATPDRFKLGPKYLSSKMYQCCPPEDLTLATMLMRWTSVYKDDLSRESTLTEDNYGSVRRVYIICNEDQAVTKDLQDWMIGNNPVEEVKVIEDADHMPMLSKPQELCFHLFEIAKKYS